MPRPGPTGNPVNAPVLTGSKQHQIEQIRQWLAAVASKTAGDEWVAYAESHLREGTAAQLYAAWILTAEGKAIATGLQVGLDTGSNIINAIPSALSSISPDKFLALLTSGSLWIRVAEVILGLGLLIIGVAKLASGTPLGSAALKVGETAAIL